MLPTKREAAAELLRRREARRQLAAYINFTSPKYKQSGFSAAVCAALDLFLDDMQAGKRPILILQAPPQHGKSEIVSRKLPAYILGRFPDWRVGAASYSDELANAMAQDVRRNLADDKHRRLFPQPAEKRRYDVNRTGEFTAPGGAGGYLGVGVGAGLTGRPLDCLVAGTMVDTDCGPIPIEELKIKGASCKILAYRNGRLSYERIKAFASGPGFGIYRITTARGRILEATGNHRIYTARGYVKAAELTPGDLLLSALLEGTNRDGSGLPQTKEQILFLGLRGGIVAKISALRRLRFDIAERLQWGFLRQLPIETSPCEKRGASHISPDSKCLLDVPERVHVDKSRRRQIFGVLRETLCRQSSCDANGWEGKSEVEGWSDPTSRATSFGKSVSDDPPWNFVTGRAFVRYVRKFIKTFGGPSYRRELGEQCVVEFSDAMCNVPQRCASSDGWKAEADRVVGVERVGEEAFVYDIQVENAGNFFANGLLVHNCGIIDDPVKNEKEALSPTVKEGHWNWYQTVFTTRLSENSGQIIMATSWAEDDLPARICKHFNGDPRLTVLRFPAINLPGEVGYNPNLPQGPLVPELKSLAFLQEVKSLFSDYWWAAMYQQSPRALGGNVFKETGLRYYFPKDLPTKFDKVLASWDCTFKDTDGTDFVVGQVWGKAGANAYLLGQVRARMSFTKTVGEVVKLKNEWPRIREILIEDKANGPAVIDTLKGTVSGIIPIEPDGSKLARAHAVTSYWEAGNVWLPHPDVAPWVKELVAELTAFPAAANDDQVDALTQALRRLYPLFNKLKITQEALNKAMGRG